MSYQELLNKEELQLLQDEFCAIKGILAYCLNAEGEILTQVSGEGDAKGLMKAYQEAGLIQNVLERVQEGSLEELAVEEEEDLDVRVAAIAVRENENTIFYWVIAEPGRKEKIVQFNRMLDFVRDTSYILITSRISCFSAEVESRRSRNAEAEMSRDLRTVEATTEIVQLLDSDDPVEGIMEKWLVILAKHLEADTAYVYQVHADDDLMDIICDWKKPEFVYLFDRTRNIPSYRFLHTSKPLAFTINNAPEEFRQTMRELGLQSVIVFPIIKQENGSGLVLALNHTSNQAAWNAEAVKFASDAVKILQSILTRRIQKNSLAGSYAVLEAILDNVGCAIYVMDKKTNDVLFANRRLQNIFATELREGTFRDLISQGRESDCSSGAYEVLQQETDQWYDLIYKEIPWVDGRAAKMYSLYEITDKKLYQKKIEQQAFTDFLTGLYNRMCCERDLARQIDEAKHNGEIGAILYIDLDDFKHINDGLGHQYGDVLLKAISHALKSIRGIRNTCYRMGGDEFIIVVPPIYYPEFDRIIEEIKQIFSKPWFLKDADYYCTMSMGVVTFPDGGDFVADLVKKADIAMYEAKKTGKNRIVRYQEGIDSAFGRRLDIEKNMRDATADGYREFEVFYQPVINVEQGAEECIGAEALIRWNSRKLGFIPPAEFIPLAEYLGLINPIGNYVLREACCRCKEWNESGYPDYKVNVNLSVVQLLQADIVEIVERTLQETQLKPSNLTLEVTESLAINDMERMKEILNKIKALGVKIALDDFGTGYSSLNHIREIPLDVIKVDRSFVKDMTDDPYSQSFIKMIVELGESIGVGICIEGVETDEQYKILQSMNVKYIQGYYFDRPMRRKEFEEKYVR